MPTLKGYRWRADIPLNYHLLFYTLALLFVYAVNANQASFDLEKGSRCEKPCFNGVCLNGTCVCTKGWTGSQCDHCAGRVRLSPNTLPTNISDGPLHYNSQSRCSWLIDSANNTTFTVGPLNLKIDSFNTECGWDYLYIYDGDGVWGRQLAALCGDQPSQELQAPSGRAFIYFSSDLAMNLDGFNIVYEYNKCSYNCSEHGICTNRQCICDVGYTGEFCELRICSEVDEGGAGPCKNDGICSNGKCTCNDKAHGEFCQTPSDEGTWDELLTQNPKPVGRASQSSVLIDDTVWHIGGEHFDSSQSSDEALIRIYDLESKSWEFVDDVSATVPKNRYDHSVVRYKSRLYMFGGVIDRRNITSELWSFDISTRQWSLVTGENIEIAAAPFAVAGHTAHVYGSQMFVFFGYNPLFAFMHYVQIFDFETNQWSVSNTTDHVYGRYRHTSVQYNGIEGPFVLIYGGSLKDNNITDSLIRFDLRKHRWTVLPSSGIQLVQHSAVMLNGLMMVTGGNGYNATAPVYRQQCFSNFVFYYDIACNQWLFVSQKAPEYLKRYGHSSITWNGSVYVFGGYNGKMLNDVWRFEPPLCSSVSRPENCRTIAEGTKCVFQERACQRLDPNSSYKTRFMDTVTMKADPRSALLLCPTTPLRQAIDTCNEQKDCVSCASKSGCGWCLSGSQCLPTEMQCVDGSSSIITTWEKCPSSPAPPQPRPCQMATDCGSCRLLPHCNWFHVDKQQERCISRQEQLIYEQEAANRELQRLQSASSALHLGPSALVSRSMNHSTECLLPCARRYNCTECVSVDRCIWCPSTERCISQDTYSISFAYGQCRSWVTSGSSVDTTKMCLADASHCSAYKTCSDCERNPECGWLDDGSQTGLGRCMAGSASGPIDPPENYNPLSWYFTDCPACQCNGHSTCFTSSASFGGHLLRCGTCKDNTTGAHCEQCADGYFGDPRNGGSCTPCQCNGQADTCNHWSGVCYCRTKGVTGDHCQKCEQKYYGTPRNGTPCYYELSVDFIFTFKLRNDEKDSHVNEIFLFSVPYKKDTDVTFQINCDNGSALVALNMTSQYFEGFNAFNQPMMYNTTCNSKGFRRVYVASDKGYTFGTESNTTFFVRVYNFTTPITITVSFAQSPPINWVLFFVIFAACFIVLLVVAGLLWMIKVRIEAYRRNQRRIDEIEHMASRPFSSVKLDLSTPYTSLVHSPTPLSVEPCSNYKAGVYTLAVRLPTGGRASTPSGTSGLAVASSLCLLTPAQLGVLQAPENPEARSQKTGLVRRCLMLPASFQRQRRQAPLGNPNNS